ncbi:phosphatidylethanolamine-binding protein, partial [Vararia minispora EC-137]
MVDPDAPSPQDHSHSDVRHFVGPNFHLGASGKLTNSTPALSEFRDPRPTAFSTPHRYTLLAFVQPPGFMAAATPIIRENPSVTNFNLTSFVAATGLGDPVAGTFFLTGSD